MKTHSLNEENDVGNTRNDESNGVKHLYRDECWSQNNFTYDSMPMEFLGRNGTIDDHYHAPTILFLFHLFWPTSLLEKIVNETSRYATHCMDALGNTRGGMNWMNLSIVELKAFLAVHMYMGLKKQPNIQTYWERAGSIFHYPIVSNIMMRERFKDLQRCLHLTDPTTMSTFREVIGIMISCTKLDGL
jgi:hypothetical protein